MPRPASSIIARAGQIAKVGNISATGTFVGYASQALDELNSILDDITQTVDFAAATAQFNFVFNTNLVFSGSGNITTAGPNPLPLDYLRVQTSGGATGAQRTSKWYLQGVPYDMVEIDLTEWDDQVQQAGMQSYPYFWAKDMSQRAVILNTIGDLSTSTTTVANIPSTAAIVAGMSIAGGIGPLSIIVPGTTVASVTNANSIVLSQAPATPSGQQIALPASSLMIGYPPVGYPYPPPSGAFQAMIRYQRFMPPLTQAQVNNGAYCWFDDDDFLRDALAAKLMRYSDHTEREKYEASAKNVMAGYIKAADDRSNRAQAVQLDRRSFGKGFSDLKDTKHVGW